MMYEIMTIIPTRYADTELDGVIETVTKLIDAAGAKVEKSTNLGKIKFAYPIDRQRYGTYVLFYAELTAEVMPKLEQNLKLSEEVVRHLIIARPEGIPATDYRLVSYVAPVNAEGRRASERDERPATAAPRKEDGAPEKTVVPEELNNKLDQILDSDIMKNI